jgi:hypothetical protein
MQILELHPLPIQIQTAIAISKHSGVQDEHLLQRASVGCFTFHIISHHFTTGSCPPNALPRHRFLSDVGLEQSA